MKRFNATIVAMKATSISAVLLIISSFIIVPIATAADVELIVNGSFEEPIVPGPASWMTYFGQNYTGGPDCPPGSLTCNDGDLVPGWSAIWTDTLGFNIPEPGRIELQSDRFLPYIANCPAKVGFQKAELDSHHRLGSQDNNVTIYQFPKTCPGLRYTFTYSWKGRQNIFHQSDLDVLIDDVVLNEHRAFGLSWSNELYYFTANKTYETALAFKSCGDGNTLGVFIDAVSIIGPDGSNPEECDEPEDLCDCHRWHSGTQSGRDTGKIKCHNPCEKPKVLTLLYDGNDDTDHHQNGNEVIIDPLVVETYPSPAYIVIYGQNKNKPALFAGTYDIGQLITISGPKERIPSRLKFEIYAMDDLSTPVQTVQFHSSCSQPLYMSDEFGGITIWSAEF